VKRLIIYITFLYFVSRYFSIGFVPSRHAYIYIYMYVCMYVWGPRWHSGQGAVLQIGRSLVRSQLVSLDFSLT